MSVLDELFEHRFVVRDAWGQSFTVRGWTAGRHVEDGSLRIYNSDGRMVASWREHEWSRITAIPDDGKTIEAEAA